jgi:hypothetical protein
MVVFFPFSIKSACEIQIGQGCYVKIGTREEEGPTDNKKETAAATVRGSTPSTGGHHGAERSRNRPACLPPYDAPVTPETARARRNGLLRPRISSADATYIPTADTRQPPAALAASTAPEPPPAPAPGTWFAFPRPWRRRAGASSLPSAHRHGRSRRAGLASPGKASRSC